MNSSIEPRVSRHVPARTVEARKSENAQKLKGLLNHHTQCEVNYHRCLALMPGFRSGEQSWGFYLGGIQGCGTQVAEAHSSKVGLMLLESAPYTTTIELCNGIGANNYLQPSRLKVRLYHDVEMAEVVAWDRHRNWQPKYEYPNKNMYQPDEKLLLNRFLGELLYYCRKLGIAHEGVCESIRINKH